MGFVVRFCTFNAWEDDMQTHQNTTTAHTNEDTQDTWTPIGSILRRDDRLATVLDQQKALQEFCDAYDDDRFVTTYARFRG